MTIYIKNVRRNYQRHQQHHYQQHQLPGRHVRCRPNDPTGFLDIQEPIYVLYIYWTCWTWWRRMGEYSKNGFPFLVSTSQTSLNAFYLLISCTGSAAAAAACM